MGNCRLGLNLITGGTIIIREFSILIKIGPVSNKELPDYMKNGKKRQLVYELMNYFISADQNVQIEIITEKSTGKLKDLVLGENIYI